MTYKKLSLMALIFVIAMSPVIFSEVTSENNARLRSFLEQRPECDLNGDGVLTATEAMSFRDQMRKKKKQGKKSLTTYETQPTHPNIKYGEFDRNVLDFWKADSKEKAPVLVYIHGGGFIGGSKEKANKTGLIEKAQKAGYHFASINYRYKARTLKDLKDPQRTGVVGCFLDGARAIQFLKHKADEWNIDKDRIIVFGSSAGGCITLFIGFYDDLADPKSSDPILKESSRVYAIGHMNSQPTLNLDKWQDILGWDAEELKGAVDTVKAAIPTHIKLGFNKESDLKTEKGKKYLKMIDLTEHADPKDPPTFIHNGGRDEIPKNHGQIVHHPRLSKYVHQICQEQKIESKLVLRDGLSKGSENGHDEFFKWCQSKLK